MTDVKCHTHGRMEGWNDRPDVEIVLILHLPSNSYADKMYYIKPKICFVFWLFVFRRNTYDGFDYVSILKYYMVTSTIGKEISNLYYFNMILNSHILFYNDACCTSFVIPTLQFIAYHNDSFFI